MREAIVEWRRELNRCSEEYRRLAVSGGVCRPLTAITSDLIHMNINRVMQVDANGVERQVRYWIYRLTRGAIAKRMSTGGQR